MKCWYGVTATVRYLARGAKLVETKEIVYVPQRDEITVERAVAAVRGNWRSITILALHWH